MDIYCRQKLSNNRLYDPLHNTIKGMISLSNRYDYSSHHDLLYLGQLMIRVIFGNS
jgi:hypothetical protein